MPLKRPPGAFSAWNHADFIGNVTIYRNLSAGGFWRNAAARGINPGIISQMPDLDCAESFLIAASKTLRRKNATPSFTSRGRGGLERDTEKAMMKLQVWREWQKYRPISYKK
jgi:hypothetical protein